MALPQFGEEARDEAARQQDHAQTREAYYRQVARQQQHKRQTMVHHKGQIQDVFGGRSAAKHRGDTDAGRGQGRAVGINKPMGAAPEGSAGTVEPDAQSHRKATDQSEDKDLAFLQEGLERPGTDDRLASHQRKDLALLRLNAEKKSAEEGREGLVNPPPQPGMERDDPEVIAEIKHDKIDQMMREIPNQNKGNILEEEYDIDDPFAAAPDNDDDYID